MNRCRIFLIAMVLGLGCLPFVAWRAVSAQTEEGGEDACCVCLTEGCCITVDADRCTPEGTLKSADFIRELLETLQINAQELCNTCEACAESPLSEEEDQQFLDICDLCVFEPQLESRSCESLSPPVLAEEEGGCRLNPSAGGSADAFSLLVVAWALAMTAWKIGWGCKVSFTRSRGLWP
ncbi:MAG TPA: hypothetical protein VFW62_02580 [bacterium]|nr:hypothetical protein [bacterium]